MVAHKEHPIPSPTEIDPPRPRHKHFSERPQRSRSACRSLFSAWVEIPPSAQLVSVRFAPENPGAFLETGSFYPPPAALRLFPLLGFPRTLHPKECAASIKAAKPLTAALPYRCGEFTTLSTVSTAPKGPFFFARLRRNGSTSTPVCMVSRRMFIYQKTAHLDSCRGLTIHGKVL